ncbi:MAG: hypothetical protein JNM94_07280 [Phycisphaerae bacterium]|nr:hypothetical protein [Phycisphaerae bacterium]
MRHPIRIAVACLSLVVAAPAFAQHGVRELPTKLPPIARKDRPAAPAGTVEVIAEMDQTPGNLAITPNGRVFASMHPFGAPSIRVVELRAEGGALAYPSPGWAGDVGPNGLGIASIIGIRADSKGILWMLDAGQLGGDSATEPKSFPKLIAWDTNTDRLVRVIHLPPPASNRASFLQDFAIDEERDCIYIADCGITQGQDQAKPAIVVVYLKSGVSRRVLENAESVRPEADAAMVIDGREVKTAGPDGKPVVARVGINPIVIDKANEWVYFGSMHGKTMYRIKASALATPGMTDELLAEAVEKYATKPVSDGMGIDAAGNLYITDLPGNGIAVVEAAAAPGPDGLRPHRTLITDPKLSWPDSVLVGPDGHLWIVANQLHRHPALNWSDAGPTNDIVLPFAILRTPALGTAAAAAPDSAKSDDSR